MGERQKTALPVLPEGIRASPSGVFVFGDNGVVRDYFCIHEATCCLAGYGAGGSMVQMTAMITPRSITNHGYAY